ncbi:unnamed protein product [Medioppia subpectinata]|uniref:Uncharacterized protein n=1 Tax=Medioppia subpectinata TaxID=1979941 RepID=A0A7R9Q7V2_9ACAR|nr:unnamed protein product [Medioppia subpectinata]CAG2115965.1 unnamed protein product [Medioppia subpectinata]
MVFGIYWMTSNAFHAKMANYPNITTDECGISRDSLLMDNKCSHNLKCTITIYPAVLNLTNPGQGYQPKRVILHPGFEVNQTNSDDMALIELNTALDFTAPKGSHYRPVNSVCLPKADIYNTRKEYVWSPVSV